MAEDFSERLITPAMPICMAYFCCVLNFMIPGCGTVIASFSVFCCARNEDMTIGDKCTSFCCGILFGFLQLVFTSFLLIGWCWSMVWGFSYLEMSRKHYRPSNRVRRRIQPITIQPRRRIITSAENHLESNDLEEHHHHILVVSQQPHSTNNPPPSYYDSHRGHPVEGFEPPPSYDSIYPGRPK